MSQQRCNHWPGQRRCDVCGKGHLAGRLSAVDATLVGVVHELTLLLESAASQQSDRRLSRARNLIISAQDYLRSVEVQS